MYTKFSEDHPKSNSALLKAVLAFLLKPAASYQERLGEFIVKVKEGQVLPDYSWSGQYLPERSSRSKGPEALVRYSDSKPGSRYGDEITEGEPTLEIEVFEASKLYTLLVDTLGLSRDGKGSFFDGGLYVDFVGSTYQPDFNFLHYVLRAKDVPSAFTNALSRIDIGSCYLLELDLHQMLVESGKDKLAKFLKDVQLGFGLMFFDEEKKLLMLFPYKGFDYESFNTYSKSKFTELDWVLNQLPPLEEERRSWYVNLGLNNDQHKAAPITESGVKNFIGGGFSDTVNPKYSK
jgi:hypothetical protein